MHLRKTPSILAVLCGALLFVSSTHAADPKVPPGAKGASTAKKDTPAAASASASAAPSAAPAANEPPTAKSFYEQGVDLANQKNYKEAEAKFLEAWALQKSYDVAANLGVVEMELGKPVEAATYLVYALKSFPASGSSEKRVWLEARLKEARDKPVTFTVTVNVPGAEVSINGKPAGKAPIEGELFVLPGECTIEVTAPEYLPHTQGIKLAAGATKVFQIELERPKKSLVPAIVGGGVGLATVAAGVALFVISGNKYDEARSLNTEITSDPVISRRHCAAGNDPNPKCAALKSAAEESDALYAPGLALLIGGSVLTAASGAYLGFALRSSAPPKTGSRPTVTAVGVRGPGFFVQGSF